jgi:hypothetical protein
MRGDCFALQKPQTLRLKRFIATPAARFKRIDVKNVVLSSGGCDLVDARSDLRITLKRKSQRPKKDAGPAENEKQLEDAPACRIARFFRAI